MHKLDWSPFHKNGSGIFQFDRVKQQIKLHNQATFNEIIYTTKLESSSRVDLLSENQVNK